LILGYRFMDEFLRKITLLDHFTIELDVERHVFVDRLASIVDPGCTGVIFFHLKASFQQEGVQWKSY
jgi:hypothetical protein